MILGPYRCKENQTVMNRQLSTSISRKHLPENRKNGERESDRVSGAIVHQLHRNAL